MRRFVNARIYPMADASRCEALVVDEGTIVYTGTVAGAREYAPAADEIDCEGRAMIPGLVDSHMHAISTAAALTQVDLRHERTLDDAVRTIADYASRLPAGQWVTGGRWDANRWADVREPNRDLLDRLLPDRPVALWSIDFHTLWLNGAALDAVGIDDATPDPRGGRIVRDGAGRATGVLREDAATLAERVIPRPATDVLVAQMREGQRRWLAEGLTGVHDFDGEASRLAWAGLMEADELDIRVVKYLRLEEWEWAKRAGWRTGETEGLFTRGGLKLFSDGALGSRTCHMKQAFTDVDSTGLPIASTEVLIEQVSEAVRFGVAPAVHAIGDQANTDVLDAFEKATKRPLRRRIEHVQFMSFADLGRMADMKVVAAMQPCHLSSDIPLLSKLGPDPARLHYPWKALSLRGVPVAFGSDAPVEPTDPFSSIYSAMTRASQDGSDVFEAENRISLAAAIRAYTSGSAYAGGRESVSGTLEVGKDADFILLSGDPLDQIEAWTGLYGSEQALMDHAQAVRDTRAVMTVVDGQIRHG